MILDMRVIKRNGKPVLQKYISTEPLDINEEGFVAFSFKNCKWEDVDESSRTEDMENEFPRF